jgi:hypothetical protein
MRQIGPRLRFRPSCALVTSALYGANAATPSSTRPTRMFTDEEAEALERRVARGQARSCLPHTANPMLEPIDVRIVGAARVALTLVADRP